MENGAKPTLSESKQAVVKPRFPGTFNNLLSVLSIITGASSGATETTGSCSGNGWRSSPGNLSGPGPSWLPEALAGT
jgi:hypothetical protein